MEVFNGKLFRQKILDDVKNDIGILPFVPEFCDILVGSDGPSVRYVNMKKSMAKSLGINFIDENLNEDVTTDDIINSIKKILERPNICGIIVQLPLPNHIDTKRVLDSVPLPLDVDGLSNNYNDLFYGTDKFDGILIMPTVLAVRKILDTIYKQGDCITIVGQGKLIGKPLNHLLKSESKNVETIDSKTSEIEKNKILKNTDILISAVGKPNIINGNDLKQGIKIIDAGTLEVENVLVGDVDFESVQSVAEFITPTPGGVGPVTVACLMNNVLEVAKLKAKNGVYAAK